MAHVLWEKLLIYASHIRKTHKPPAHVSGDYYGFCEKTLGLWHCECEITGSVCHCRPVPSKCGCVAVEATDFFLYTHRLKLNSSNLMLWLEKLDKNGRLFAKGLLIS